MPKQKEEIKLSSKNLFPSHVHTKRITMKNKTPEPVKYNTVSMHEKENVFFFFLTERGTWGSWG